LGDDAIAGEGMRTLWGRSNSSNVMKVIWLLEELGLPYERIDVGGPFGRTRTPEYLAMNPNSTVPTLQEDDFTLWESNVILRYLCGTNAPGHAMWPDDVRAQANIARWMDWQQTTLNAPMTVVFQGMVRTPPEQRNMGAIEAALATVGGHWATLDRQLANHDYVAGPEFTLADIPLGVHVHRWFSFTMLRPETPRLSAWYHRLLDRPAYRTHCAMPMT
jgi:glutathione S-transferase